MKALYYAPDEAVDLIDTKDFEDTLGGAVEYLWPFEDEAVCLVVLADREDMETNRTFEECGTIRGPFLCVGCHDEFDDLTEEEIALLESRAVFAEKEYNMEDCNPYEEDVQDEEDCCGIHIVNEDEFYDSIEGNYL